MDEEGRLLRFNLRAAGAAKVDPEAENNSRKLADVQRQVTQYANGKRRDFDFELAAEGPEFDKKVWKALLDIPFGTTTSYGAIAKKIGHPTAARAVGAANGANPIALIVPCHRVIGADGIADRLWRRPAAQAQAAGARSARLRHAPRSLWLTSGSARATTSRTPCATDHRSCSGGG